MTGLILIRLRRTTSYVHVRGTAASSTSVCKVTTDALTVSRQLAQATGKV